MHVKLLQLYLTLQHEEWTVAMPGSVAGIDLWTVACQGPLFMGFSRQNYWSGLPCPPPGGLPHPGIEPVSLTSLASAGGFFTTSTT